MRGCVVFSTCVCLLYMYIMAALETWQEECVCGELDLSLTLSTGQAFRWHKLEDTWVGAVGQFVFALKSRDDSTLTYHTLHTPQDHTHTHTPSHILRDYFRLDTDLSELYTLWAHADPNFSSKVSKYKGIRLLRQNPLENVVSFICSSNNNIARISGMLNSLCESLGEPICCYGNHTVYGFPTLDSLCAENMESTLRGLGFGYRSKYVAMAAKSIAENGGVEWLLGLREKPYNEVVTLLRTLSGVGPKVADCVAMMSCDKLEAVPIDTHVWSVAVSDYGLARKSKSLTAIAYKEIGDHFRDLFGPMAGWAVAVLFVADLDKSGASKRESPKGSKGKRKRKDQQTSNSTKKQKT